jgi:hypothetical protein
VDETEPTEVVDAWIAGESAHSESRLVTAAPNKSFEARLDSVFLKLLYSTYCWFGGPNLGIGNHRGGTDDFGWEDISGNREFQQWKYQHGYDHDVRFGG